MEELEQIEVDGTADVPGLGLALLEGLSQGQIEVAVVGDGSGALNLKGGLGDLQRLAALAFHGAGAADNTGGGGGGSLSSGSVQPGRAVSAATEPATNAFFIV